jgi:hypothetical protein
MQLNATNFDKVCVFVMCVRACARVKGCSEFFFVEIYTHKGPYHVFITWLQDVSLGHELGHGHRHRTDTDTDMGAR